MKQEVLLGIDTIEVVIDTQTILNKNNITFYSSNRNEVGKLVHRQGKKKGYNLILNLPRCVRQNNIQPFSVLDADKIYEITTIVVKQLKKHFGEQLPDLTVKSAEVGATMEIANKKNVQPILNMITGMLLQDKENIVYIACRGKKVGQRYNKVQTLASGINVESIKLPQNSSGRFASKYYDKGLEKDIADEHGIIRVEHIYNKRGLNYAHTGNSLDRCYGRDYRAVVQEQKEQNIETHMTLTVINPRNKIDMNNLTAELEQAENAIDTEDEEWEQTIYKG